MESFKGKDLLKTVGILAGATLVGTGFRELLFPETNNVVIYIFAVLLTARVTSGYLWGLISSIAAVLCYNYFFTAPYHTLAVNDPSYFVTFVIMVITAVMTSALTTKGKLLKEKAEENASVSRILYDLSSRLSDAADMENIMILASESVGALFQTEAGCICFTGETEPFSIWKCGDGIKKRKEENWEKIREGFRNPEEECWKDKNAWYYAVRGHGRLLAVMELPAETEWHQIHKKEKLLYSVLENIALAMERIQIITERMRDREKMEQERYRANLLRSISHDIRTPLSGIMGTSEMLLSMTEETDRRYDMIQGIYHDADWLKELVENILSLTRLQDGKIHVNKEMEALEEVAACAVERIEKASPDREIQITLPEEFYLVPMDGKLIQQVITNLLTNAVKHTKKEEKIELIIGYENDRATVTVRDEGEGLADTDVPNVFQMFYTSKERAADVKRGIGLGLTICKTIVEAHGGGISGRNRTDRRGAEFTFWLPAGEESL